MCQEGLSAQYFEKDVKAVERDWRGKKEKKFLFLLSGKTSLRMAGRRFRAELSRDGRGENWKVGHYCAVLRRGGGKPMSDCNSTLGIVEGIGKLVR